MGGRRVNMKYVWYLAVERRIYMREERRYEDVTSEKSGEVKMLQVRREESGEVKM